VYQGGGYYCEGERDYPLVFLFGKAGQDIKKEGGELSAIFYY
jgi:hypothetical protein